MVMTKLYVLEFFLVSCYLLGTNVPENNFKSQIISQDRISEA